MPFNHFEVEASSDLSARHFCVNDQVVYDPRAFTHSLMLTVEELSTDPSMNNMLNI